MMQSEFIKRTGFEPTEEEYREIEAAYYEFDGDKDAFCQDFLENEVEVFVRARAKRIAELEGELEAAARRQEKVKAEYEQRISRLQEELDKELEWKPCSGGTNFPQEEYEKLAGYMGIDGAPEYVLTDQEAKDMIYQEFGFAPEKVKIITTVHTYEANKYHRMRKSGEYDRKPVYAATDWNYIRFDCAQWQYEMVNGDLKFYEA